MRSGFCGLFHIFLFSAAILFTPVHLHAQTSVWIDTDPGLGMLLKDSDDSMGLAYAMKSPRFRVEGISVSYGNSYVPKSLKVARSVVEKFGSNPKSQLALIFPGAPSRQFLGLATDSTVALEAALNKKRLVYIALGPLTNLATLLQTRPALAKNIDQIIWVAGRPPGANLKIGTTNPFAFHDANFEKDPKAAAVVLEAKIPMTLISRALAQDFLMTRDEQKALFNSGPSGKWLASEADHWMTLWKTGWKIEGAPMPDVLAFLAVSHPTSLQSEPCFVGQSMDLKTMVPPKDNQEGKFLLVSPEASPGQDRPVTYISDIAATAKEAWLRVMTDPPEKPATQKKP